MLSILEEQYLTPAANTLPRTPHEKRINIFALEASSRRVHRLEYYCNWLHQTLLQSSVTWVVHCNGDATFNSYNDNDCIDDNNSIDKQSNDSNCNIGNET